MSKILIIGAGGHGREVLDILVSMDIYNNCIMGFIDDNKKIIGTKINNYPVIGDLSWLENKKLSDYQFISAIGTCQVNRKVVFKLIKMGVSFINVISPYSIISKNVKFGIGITIFPGVIINDNVQLGNYSIVNVDTSISHDSIIGDFVNLNPGVRLAGNVKIGNGSYIGMGANVIQGKCIGDWSIIGAGSVVVEDLPSNITAVGVPAKVIKKREQNWHD